MAFEMRWQIYCPFLKDSARNCPGGPVGKNPPALGSIPGLGGFYML